MVSNLQKPHGYLKHTAHCKYNEIIALMQWGAAIPLRSRGIWLTCSYRVGKDILTIISCKFSKMFL